jgi:hypothetical protein
VAILALGPPLGRLLLSPTGAHEIWLEYVRRGVVRPEPTEHARYLLALLGPLLVGGATFALAGRRVGDALTATLVPLARALLVAFVLVCVVYQETSVTTPSYTHAGGDSARYFTPVTLLAALVMTALAVLALRHEPTRARLAALTRETPAVRGAAVVVAAGFVLLWLLSAFNTDATLPTVNPAVLGNVPFWSDEAFAILGGQAPLVDFHAQYGHLWAYLAAGAMTVFGASFAVYAVAMLAGTAAALAAVYATFRRVTGSSLAALALFLPFVATSFFMEGGPLENRYGPANLFSLYPIRYAGPLVLLWLVVRRVARPPTRPPLLLFAFAGLVAINNVEFGVPAFAAAFVALAATDARRSTSGIARLAGSAAAGLAGAIVLVCALTLAVGGGLPRFGTLATFPQIYGTEGFGMLPMPALGLHLVVYTTFTAAIVVAAVRVLTGGADATGRALTGALAWAGIFGLGAGAYFAGRSHAHVLIDLFAAWSLGLSLLTVVAVQAMLRRTPPRPSAVELLLLVGFAVGVCSLAQTPTPWSQLQRLGRTQPRAERVATRVTQAVDRLTTPGEPVALLIMEGHRTAYELGLDDVTPYANIESMMTRQQWVETLTALRDAGGRRILLPRTTLVQEELDLLARAGYRPEREVAGLGIVEYVAR